MTDNQDVKGRMRKRLEEIGLSLADLARATHDTYRNVQRWVGEDTAPPVEFLARFCAATGTGADWLVLGRGDPTPIPPTEAEARLRLFREVMDQPLGELTTRPAAEGPSLRVPPADAKTGWSRIHMNTPTPQNTVGARLRYVREHMLRLGMRELARALAEMEGAVTHSALRNYERDERQPTADYLAALIRLAREYGHDLSGHWVLTGEGEPELTVATEAEDQVRQIRLILLGTTEPAEADHRRRIAEARAAKDRAAASAAGPEQRPYGERRSVPRKRRGA